MNKKATNPGYLLKLAKNKRENRNLINRKYPSKKRSDDPYLKLSKKEKQNILALYL